MKKTATNCLFVVVFLFVASIDVNAQSYQKTDLGVKAEINSVAIEVQFYSPSIVRILKSPGSRSFSKESLSVIKKPQKTSFSVKQQGDFLNLKTAILTVALNMKTSEFSYSTEKGESLLKERENSLKFTPFNDAGSNTIMRLD